MRATRYQPKPFRVTAYTDAGEAVLTDVVQTTQGWLTEAFDGFRALHPELAQYEIVVYELAG